MKKLINRPGAVVEEMIQGLAAIFPGLVRIPGQMVLVRADLASIEAEPQTAVALISGGGSGHEPAHAGYVGHGMLSAAVLGEVFTSPPPDAVLAAIRAVTGPPGAILIVKNYTGDRLNFGLAAELARAEGYKVEMVVVADDVALAETADTGLAGRRGLAGTVLVHKIAGAAAAAGLDLASVVAIAREAADSVATMGVALSPCTVPAVGRAGFTLEDDEIELGLGIHGEPGVSKAKLESADDLVDRLLAAIIGDLRLEAGEHVALLVNNLGGSTTMELAIVARRAIGGLETRGLKVDRVYVGTFLSALEMAGVSLSVIRLDANRLGRLDAPTDAPAWPNPSAVARSRLESPLRFPEPESEITGEYPIIVGLPKTALGQKFEVALMAATHALAAAAPRLTELDRATGDGDLGISLTRGAQALRDALGSFSPDDPASALQAIGRTLQAALGGTSGPLYAVFFLRGSALLKRKGKAADPRAWAEAFRSGCEGIAELGGARRGDRTMLDALWPAAESFSAAVEAKKSWSEALTLAAEAAERGAACTAMMPPRRGRSSYLGHRVLGLPDPGAEAAAVWLQALARSLKTQ